MMQKLFVSLLAVVLMTATAQAQLNATVSINQPTFDNDAPRSWKLTFTGGFTNAAGWTVDEFEVVMFLKAGGISKTYATRNAAPNNQWSITTNEAIPSGVYKAFVIAKTWNATPVANPNPAEGVPPPPPPAITKYNISSQPIEFNTATLAGGAGNQTQQPATYATLTFNAGPPVRLVTNHPMVQDNILATATPGPGNYVPRENEAVGTDYSVNPILVAISNDGNLFRFPGYWEVGQNQQRTARVDTTTDKNILARWYMYTVAIRTLPGGGKDSQLICTEISTPR